MKILTDVDTREFDAMIDDALGTLTDKREQRKYVRAMALTFVKKVIPRTPVDTGRARAGFTAVPRSPRVKGAGAAEGRKQSEYKEQASRDSYAATLTNAVPYITYLELGSSQQAPSGFIRLTLREMSGQAAKEGERRTEAALRLANRKARARAGVRQGIGRRPGSGRFNIARR